MADLANAESVDAACSEATAVSYANTIAKRKEVQKVIGKQ